MSHRPEDDQDLVSFLRHHRPNPPPAHPDLEEQILEDLPPRIYPRRWMVPSAIAASLLGAIAMQFLWQSQTAQIPDVAALELYMETNWSSTIHGNLNTRNAGSSTDYLALVETTEK